MLLCSYASHAVYAGRASPFLQMQTILKLIFLELNEIIWFPGLSLNPVLYYLLNREKNYSFI